MTTISGGNTSSGPAFFTGAVEPTKTLDSSTLTNLKPGDEYYVAANSGTVSAGMLFFCVDPTAGAAKWQRSTAVALVLDGRTYTGTQSFTLPSFCSYYEFEAVGAAAGGASGRVSASGTSAYGGEGGNGGWYAKQIMRSADLGSITNVSIVFGTPGVGGAAQTTNSTDGNPGTASTNSTISFSTNNFMIMSGTSGGRAGSNTGKVAAGATGSSIFYGAGAVNVTANTVGANPVAGQKGGPGGAAGGNIISSTAYGGGTGLYNLDTNGNLNSGGAVGTNGKDGIDSSFSSYVPANGSPSGGGAALTGAAGAGGKGISRGQGGAGGGAAVDGQGGSGKGGDGAPAFVVIIGRP